MSGKRHSPCDPSGFTLIEVIVIITMGGLIASLIAPFLGTALTRSGEPVNELTELYQLQRAMEKIAADYRKRLNDETLDLAAFQADPTQDFTSAETQDCITDPGITVSAVFVDYYAADGVNLNDSDGDGIYDPRDTGGVNEGLVLVTVTKGQQGVRSIFGE